VLNVLLRWLNYFDLFLWFCSFFIALQLNLPFLSVLSLLLILILLPQVRLPSNLHSVLLEKKSPNKDMNTIRNNKVTT